MGSTTIFFNIKYLNKLELKVLDFGTDSEDSVDYPIFGQKVAKSVINNIADRFDEVLCLNRHCCAYGDPLKVFTQDVLSELYGSHGTMFQNHKLGSHGEN